MAHARLHGWPIDDYINPSHPVQQEILSTFAEMCVLPQEQVRHGTDGCSAPNFAVPLHNAALAFARLADPGQDAVDRFESGAEKIHKYLQNNVFFDVSGAIQWGKPQLECAVKVFGPDHILYGSSYPIRRDWFLQGIGFLKGLDIAEADKELILGKNAYRDMLVASLRGMERGAIYDRVGGGLHRSAGDEAKRASV